MAHDIHQAELEFPLSRLDRVPSVVKTIAVILLVLGGIGIFASFAGDATRGWRAYLFNWLFWTSVAQGAVIFAAAVAMARGIWSRPVRRIALSFVAFLPISFILLDRKSTRLNSSHVATSYAVFCLKTKTRRSADRGI